MQNSAAEHSADVKMEHVIAQTEKQPGQLQRVPWIENVVRFLLAMAGNIDDRAWDSTLKQKAPDGHQIGFHPSVRRRIWPQQKDFHVAAFVPARPDFATTFPRTSANCFATLVQL